MTPLPFRAPLVEYEQQAQTLLDGWRAGDNSAVEIIRHRHPRFLDDTIKWLPKSMTDEEARRIRFEYSDAQFTVARWYGFADWPSLAVHVEAVTQSGSPVALF